MTILRLVEIPMSAWIPRSILLPRAQHCIPTCYWRVLLIGISMPTRQALDLVHASRLRIHVNPEPVYLPVQTLRALDQRRRVVSVAMATDDVTGYSIGRCNQRLSAFAAHYRRDVILQPELEIGRTAIAALCACAVDPVSGLDELFVVERVVEAEDVVASRAAQHRVTIDRLRRRVALRAPAGQRCAATGRHSNETLQRADRQTPAGQHEETSYRERAGMDLRISLSARI